jgi:hypothetical protein
MRQEAVAKESATEFAPSTFRTDLDWPYMRQQIGFALFLIAALATPGAMAGALPSRPGTCAWSKIKRVAHRLQEDKDGPFVPDSGSAVDFANGGHQVWYQELDAVHHSRAGDQVMICLVSVPQHCPKGDNRGRMYTTTNLRTFESWTMPDAEHQCGGA